MRKLIRNIPGDWDFQERTWQKYKLLSWWTSVGRLLEIRLCVVTMRPSVQIEEEL